MNDNPVSLHIERIVLDGFPVTTPGSTMQIQTAVQNELTRLLNQNGLPPTSVSLAAITAPDFQITGKPAPAELGRNIARSIFASLRPCK